MELFRTQQYYILLNKDSTLWIDRHSGQVDAKPAWELANGQDIECLGVFYGLVGRIKFNNIDRFILIRDSVLVGTVPIGNEVYKIKSIVLLNPSSDTSSDLGLRVCSKHNYEEFVSLSVTPEVTSTGNSAIARTWGNIKSVTLNQLKPSTHFQGNLQTKGTGSNYRENSNLSKNEKRIEDEIYRIFTDSDSFYYCPDNKGDITNTVPRQGLELDDRFFWNKHMLLDIFNINNEFSQTWINPIIQGYVEISPMPKLDLSLILISRRSRFRAGTRYKRRGLDQDGHCANFVETEQIISYKSHAVSFVQVRGSVPLYWSQPGIKYRPAPILHRNFTDNQQAFEKHFEKQLSLYDNIVIVNLVEQLGKESIIFSSYTDHVIQYNHPNINYVIFDFHEYCRGMHFERVSLLISKLKEESIFKQMGYSWKDKQGLICKQNSVFRVNCIDCLDRTNVVQTALAKAILIKQLKKLGIVSPEGDLSKDMNTKFQVMWANNGDIISKQYAGTAALKGDFTRTGDRKFSGLMKDGMTSANRYYLSRFKDNMRQTCLDIMCGEIENTDKISDDDDDDEDEHDKNDEDEEEDEKTIQHIKQLIEDCKRLMVCNTEQVINAWPLIEYNQNDDTNGGSTGVEISHSGGGGTGGIDDFDSIVILTKDMLKICEYNVDLDTMNNFTCILLNNITSLSLGPLTKNTSSNNSYSGSSASSNKQKRLYLKITTNKSDENIILTSSRIHYFNNQINIMKTLDEKNESLRAIIESIQICMRLNDACARCIDINYNPIDVKKTSNVVNNVMSLIKKHRKPSNETNNFIVHNIISNVEMGKEAVESYIPNIGIIRSNVSIENTDELDIDDILIQEDKGGGGGSVGGGLSDTSTNVSHTSNNSINSASSIDKHSSNIDLNTNEELHSIIDKKNIPIKQSQDDLKEESNKEDIKENRDDSEIKDTKNKDKADEKIKKKSNVIVKLNSCDIVNTTEVIDKKQLTLNLINNEVLNINNNATATSNLTSNNTKITKSSSEKDLLSSTNNIRTSQSDNTSLKENIKTVMVSPTNVLSKFVTKGVQNLNNLDPRRRLSMNLNLQKNNNTSNNTNNTTINTNTIVMNEIKEKIENKWKKYQCKSKLIAL